MTLRIIVADDHPVVRIGARAYIESESAGVVVAEAGSSKELLEVLSTHQCDLVVTDLAMAQSRKPDGVELIRTLRHDYPEIPVVVLTAHKEIWLWRALIDLGVLGLLDKTSAMPELPKAIVCASDWGEIDLHQYAEFTSRRRTPSPEIDPTRDGSS